MKSDTRLNRKLALLLGMTSLALGACTHVTPWEREVLARDDMQLDANAIDTALDDHIYFSKEGTSGGRGFGGGGCGCN